MTDHNSSQGGGDVAWRERAIDAAIVELAEQGAWSGSRHKVGKVVDAVLAAAPQPAAPTDLREALERQIAEAVEAVYADYGADAPYSVIGERVAAIIADSIPAQPAAPDGSVLGEVMEAFRARSREFRVRVHSLTYVDFEAAIERDVTAALAKLQSVQPAPQDDVSVRLVEARHPYVCGQAQDAYSDDHDGIMG